MIAVFRRQTSVLRRQPASGKRQAANDNRHDSESGQALVELAIVLPILILVLVAIVDFGRVFHGNLAVTTAAREAARQASLGRTDEIIVSTAKNAAAPLDPTLITVSITPAFASRTAGTNIEVTVQYQMAILTPVMQKFFPNPYYIVGKAVMKRE